MRKNNILCSCIIAGALGISALLGVTLKDNLNPILATSEEYSIVLNKDNGQVTNFKGNETEETVVAKTKTKNDVTFGYVKCSKGNNSQNLVQISSEGSFYNIDAITNISKITITTSSTLDDGLPIYFQDENKVDTGNDIFDFDENGVGSVLTNSDNTFYFKLDPDLQSALIKEIRIDYLCYKNSLNILKLDKTNANVKESDLPNFGIAADESHTMIFGEVGLIKNGICNVKAGSCFYNQEAFTGLRKVIVEIANGIGTFSYGTYPYCNPYDGKAIGLKSGINTIEIPEGNEFFDILSMGNNSFDIVSITIIYSK